MTENYYNLKHENGYSIYEIERKRLSLEGVLVPVTAKWNEELLYNSGFKFVDCFWRWFNFMGLVAIK
jgi:tRNA (cmo5U34)-methyltransferase